MTTMNRARIASIYLLASVATAQCETDILRVGSPQSDEAFGLSLSVDGDTLLGGAPYREAAGQYNGGAAFVFVQNGGQWTQQARLERSTPDFEDRFGYDVAVQGDRALIGVPGFGPPNGGRGLVFERSGAVWTWIAALQASDMSVDRQLGLSVTLDGDVAVVGSPIDDELANNSGVAYVFERVAGTWVEVSKLLPNGPGTQHNSRFAYSMAVDGDTLAVGAPGRYERGAVFVFRRGASTWDLEQVLEATPLQREFGRDVDLEGDRLLVGAGKLNATAGPGKAYIFQRSGGAWTQDSVFVESVSGACDGSFGAGVALQGELALIGSPGQGCDGGGTEGAVHLFELTSGDWSPRWSHEPEQASTRLLGSAVALESGLAFASAPGSMLGMSLPSAGEVLAIDPDAGASPYCVAAVNSAGAGAQLSWSGTPRVSAADFALQVSGAIPGKPGLFYYGPDTTRIPFGDGFRCVGGSTYRLNPPVFVGPGGAAELTLDFSQPPVGSGPGALLAGSTWNFQFWYRDPAAGAAGFNLSDGLAATFCE